MNKRGKWVKVWAFSPIQAMRLLKEGKRVPDGIELTGKPYEVPA